MEKFYNCLDDLINTVKNTSEYKKCIELKELMSKNNDICELVKLVKNTQKKYIKSNYDKDIKKELYELEEKLNNIPIYNIYLNNLEKVNYYIDYIKDDLNNYFYELLN